eukprot:6463784-Amphidinium_carterae.1
MLAACTQLDCEASRLLALNLIVKHACRLLALNQLDSEACLQLACTQCDCECMLAAYTQLDCNQLE